MMKLYCFILLWLSGYAVGNVVSNVRLIEPENYIINVIGETVRQVEQRQWCNLKVPDVTYDLNELVLGWRAEGPLEYKNGFVASIDSLDIRQDTVAFFIALNADQQAQATIRGTLRMHDVAIGYDVVADFEHSVHHYTMLYVHPLINFAFTILKVIDSDDIDVSVVGTIPASNSIIPQFLPTSKATDVFTTLYNRTMSNDDIVAWATTVFQPIATEVATTVPFPSLCYNCAA